MGTPFLGELKLISWNYAPKGWAFCNGQLLPINQNQALFSLFGTMYGGNGQTNFALPNLRGQVPIHVGNGHVQGEAAGAPSVTITQQSLPTHIHGLRGQTEVMAADANAQNPAGRTLAGAQTLLQSGQPANVSLYGQPASLVPLNAQAVSNTGGSQPHNNMMPYLVLNWIVALQGVFPSRN